MNTAITAVKVPAGIQQIRQIAIHHSLEIHK